MVSEIASSSAYMMFISEVILQQQKYFKSLVSVRSTNIVLFWIHVLTVNAASAALFPKSKYFVHFMFIVESLMCLD